MFLITAMQKWHACSLALWIVAVGGSTAGVCHAQATSQPLSREDRLRSALQNYLQGPRYRNFEPTSYLYAFVDLAGNGKREAVAYLTARGWCGSGGCHLIVLTQNGPTYRVITTIPAVKLPIRVLESKSHRWRDLSAFIQGGGIMDGYDEMIRFNGKGYKESTGEAEGPRVSRMKGKAVLSWGDKEVPLYR